MGYVSLIDGHIDEAQERSIVILPKTCGECKFIGYYEEGIWSRNPHCCCELMFDLYDEDYKVDKDSMDENCPLKDLEKTFSKVINKEGIKSET